MKNHQEIQPLKPHKIMEQSESMKRRNDRNGLIGLVIIIILGLVAAGLCSCTPTRNLQSAHGGRVHSNAAYRSLYYHPNRKHSPKWYDRHQIYWWYRPASHPEGTRIKPYSHKYLYR